MSSFEQILKYLERNNLGENGRKLIECFGHEDRVKLSIVKNTVFKKPGQTKDWVYEVVIIEKIIYVYPELFYDKYIGEWSFLVKAKEGKLRFTCYQNNSKSAMQLAHDIYPCQSSSLGFLRVVGSNLAEAFNCIYKEYSN